ncbi:MAG TPA: NAD(P)/FAD-dependent oxidoreductase [Thermoanaerobaculia bacterium]|jgi:NADH dehydrogenase|nr:NAD(P)/FAD-dependent oxidoreductase [Thermoanaerobaculia bacterium]
MRVTHPNLRPGQKEVVIVGAGFAGLNAAKELANRDEVHVVLIDQKNHHLFQPLLYQVATAGLNPADIAVPIRAQFSDAANVSVHLLHVETLNLAEKWIGLEGDVKLAFDYLILACGAQHSYFGKPEWEPYAPGLKTIEQAIEIRRRILSAFENAENEIDPGRQQALLTFVVVGGGATGVELAGAIADISRTVLVKDFRRINPASARIVLVEAGPRILPAFPEDLAARAARDLTRMGVEVRTNSLVGLVDAEGVKIGDETLPAKTVLWAAGVQAERISRTLGVELDRSGRVKVGPDLSIPGLPDVFVAGDLAHLDLGDGKILPGLAPAAIQTGRAAARNILASIRGKARKTFHYTDKGQMATIGKRRAIAQTGPLKLTGFVAWLVWLFVHILYLVGFKNRFFVFLQWVWSYLFSKRGSRLITSADWTLNRE